MGAALYGDELSRGALVGRFAVEEVRHRGEAAVLYLAHDVGTRARAAVKVLRAQLTYSPTALKRFRLECETLQRLAHPKIVRVLECGELSDGRPYLAMEWLEGRDLAAELEARGPLSLPEAQALLAQVVAALEAAHALGIVHRDVKAQNVVLRRREGGDDVTLVDFGIAKLLDPATGAGLTSTGVAMGTPFAMAPEQILGAEVNPRTDVYGLGVMLFQLLTGQAPFQAPSRTELEALHLRAPIPAPSALAPLPRGVDEVVQRALAKRPEHRYESAARFQEALDEAARAGSVAAAVQALSVRVRLRCLGDLGDEAVDGEAVLAGMDLLLEQARHRVVRAGLRPLLEGGDFFLAAGAVPSEAAEADAFQREVTACVRALVDELSPAAHAIALEVEARLAKGHATIEASPSGERRPAGGPLLDACGAGVESLRF